MAIGIGANFNYQGPLPNFERDSFDTVDNMIIAGNSNKLDIGHICYITGENKHYKWNGTSAEALANSEVVNNLIDGGEDKALSAEMGKQLSVEKISSSATETVVESIEPSLVSNALRKTEQVLTDSEKEQVRQNIEAQKELTLTVKDNGNIVISNIQGQTKEFMPATPSGDPMHWAYVSAGAVYNDTNQIIQRTAPWNTEETWVKNEDGTYTYSEVPAIVQHLPNHWFLNGLGNLTNKDMNAIYEAGRLQVGVHLSNWCNSKARTNLNGRKHGGEGSGYNFYYFSNTNFLEVVYICSVSHAYVSNLHSAFNTKNVKIIMPRIIFNTTGSGVAYNALKGTTNLRQMFISGLKLSFSFRDSPNIERRCILYMINNAEPTSAITITLHADAYARLVDDADIVAALEKQPLVTLVSA